MLVELLHLSDSLFPIGSFAYSDGLESATASRLITDGEGLRAWLDTALEDLFERCDGLALVHAWRAFDAGDWDRLTTIDADVVALRPSSAARRSSAAMGRRLLTTWYALHPSPRLGRVTSLFEARRRGPSLPIAFACVVACADVECRQAAEAFAYTRLAATVSAAMRLLPIGQGEAHALLARSLDRVPAAVGRLLESTSEPESFVPAMDIAMMTQQYVHSRLFRS